MICGIYTEQQPVTWAENAADKGGFYEMGACVDHGPALCIRPDGDGYSTRFMDMNAGGTANRHWGAVQGKYRADCGKIRIRLKFGSFWEEGHL